MLNMPKNKDKNWEQQFSEAIRNIRSPRLIEEICLAADESKPFEFRLEHHKDAYSLFQGRLKMFKENEVRAVEANNRSDKTFAAYEAQRVKRDGLPKHHLDREEETFNLGIAYALAYLDVHEAQSDFEYCKRKRTALLFLGDVINENAKRLQELGNQQGPGYFRGPDAKYSGPQNAPLKPSGDSDFIMSQSECWCIYCNKKIEKSAEDKMKPCEMLVCTKCLRMLSSKVTMPNDKRVYQYGQLPKHPHNTEQT